MPSSSGSTWPSGTPTGGSRKSSFSSTGCRPAWPARTAAQGGSWAAESQPRTFRILMRVAGDIATAGADEEVQVGAGVRLQHVVGVEAGPAAGGLRRRRRPLGPAARQLVVGHLEGEGAGRDVEG